MNDLVCIDEGFGGDASRAPFQTVFYTLKLYRFQIRPFRILLYVKFEIELSSYLHICLI
jgi:hypothetical protein